MAVAFVRDVYSSGAEDLPLYLLINNVKQL